MFVKITDRNMRTYGGTQWELNVWKETSGKGNLCDSGFLHCYEGSPELAVVMNPVHAHFNSTTMRMFECEGAGVFLNDDGLKCGFSRMRLIREIRVPTVSYNVRIRFAIYCTKIVIGDKLPQWSVWADNWLNNRNRTFGEAMRVAEGVWRGVEPVPVGVGDGWWMARRGAKMVADAVGVVASVSEVVADAVTIATKAREAGVGVEIQPLNLSFLLKCAIEDEAKI